MSGRNLARRSCTTLRRPTVCSRVSISHILPGLNKEIGTLWPSCTSTGTLTEFLNRLMRELKCRFIILYHVMATRLILSYFVVRVTAPKFFYEINNESFVHFNAASDNHVIWLSMHVNVRHNIVRVSTETWSAGNMVQAGNMVHPKYKKIVSFWFFKWIFLEKWVIFVCVFPFSNRALGFSFVRNASHVKTSRKWLLYAYARTILTFHWTMFPALDHGFRRTMFPYLP